MSQELLHDDEYGTTVILTDDEYQFENDEGETIVTVPVDEMNRAIEVLDDLADPDTQVDGVDAPTGDGWQMGQLRHPLFGNYGIGFQNLETEEVAALESLSGEDAGRIADALRQ